MSKNPFLNALAATGYIVLVAGVMYYVSGTLRNTPDTIMAPIAIVSLFTLSAAVMSYLFVLTPLQMYLDGKKKEAVKLFLQTVAAFAGITVVVFVLLLARVFGG